jgi:putative FmdB family regulatory protein
MSKLISFEFECPCCNQIHEALVRPDVRERTCPACQSPNAVRIISAPRISMRMGVDPSNPSMAAKWARMHEQAKKVDEKRARDNGPGAWGADGADVRR